MYVSWYGLTTSMFDTALALEQAVWFAFVQKATRLLRKLDECAIPTFLNYSLYDRIPLSMEVLSFGLLLKGISRDGIASWEITRPDMTRELGHGNGRVSSDPVSSEYILDAEPIAFMGFRSFSKSAQVLQKFMTDYQVTDRTRHRLGRLRQPESESHPVESFQELQISGDSRGRAVVVNKNGSRDLGSGFWRACVALAKYAKIPAAQALCFMRLIPCPEFQNECHQLRLELVQASFPLAQ